MDAHTLKQMVAREAIDRVMTAHGNDLVVGIGTGNTAECFIASCLDSGIGFKQPCRAQNDHPSCCVNSVLT